jgi:hypothetical protein
MSNQFRLAIALVFQRAGWLSALVAIPFLLAAWLHFGALAEKAQAQHQLRQDIADASQGEMEPPKQSLLETRHQKFRAYLISRAALPSVAQTLVTEAGKAGLTVAQADYQLRPSPDSDYLTYRISLPVQGSYTSIRAFIDAFLNALPAAALTELSFNRDNVGMGNLESKLEFVVFVRAEP